ncbi:MAG TPA: hypothetical protein VHS74_00515 [Solirubrobacterales bacterium]|nr:hypothetical protein [Solirubrobacterales bacterium]
MYRTGAVGAAIGLAMMLASCGGGGGTTPGGTTTSGGPADGSTTKVPSVGAHAERAGTTAKRKGAAGTSPPAEPHRAAKPDDGSPTSNGITYGGEETPTFEVAKAGSACQARLGDLVDRMDDLRQALLAGLDYSEYVLRVQAVRAAYEAVPVDRLPLACVAGPAGHAEDAFNQYLRAANLWGECAGTAGCAASSIESRLQRRWRIASKSLDAAKRS